MERTRKKGDKTVFFTSRDPFGDETEEFNSDLSRPRKVHYRSEWKHHLDAVHWIHLARARDKGLQFWQTRSHAIVFYDSVAPDCIEQMASLQGGNILYQRDSTPRPALEIVLKDAGSMKNVPHSRIWWTNCDPDIPNRICHRRFEKERKIQPKTIQRLGNIELYELGEVSKKTQRPSCSKY